MEIRLAAAIDTAVAETLELMCFTGLVGRCAERPSGNTLTTSVTFHGDADGMLRLCLPDRVATDLTSAFLGLDPEQVGQEHVQSVALELTNMVCGAMLSYQAEHGRFQLEQPVAPASDAQAHGTLLSHGYDTGEGSLWLDVWFHGNRS